MGRTPSVIRGYPDEALIEELRRVAGLVGKPVLFAQDFTRLAGVSAYTVAHRFGGWRAALERAGLLHMYSGEVAGIRNRFSDEQLIAELQRVAELVGKLVLTRTDFTKYSKINCATPKTRFGGWRAALERAGLGHMYTGQVEKSRHLATIEHSDEVLIEELRRVGHLVDSPMFAGRDLARYSKITPATFMRRFGSWKTALKRAGLGDRFSGEVKEVDYVTRGRYSDEELFAEVRRVAGLVGKTRLTRGEFTRFSGMDADAVGRRFGGSWKVVLERAGLGHMFSDEVPEATLRVRKRHTEEELLAELQRVAKLVAKPVLSRADFRKHSSMDACSLARRLGGWQEALERAGLDHMSWGRSWGIKKRYSDNDMLDELRRVAPLVGKPVLTRGDFTKHSELNADDISRRFGNWRMALERAGLVHLHFGEADDAYTVVNRKRTDEDLLEQVRLAAEALGKQVLTRDDFRNHTGINDQIVCRRFGNWKAALERAGLGHMFYKGSATSQESTRKQV